MAKHFSFPRPLLMPEGNTLKLNNKTAKALEDINGNVVVIAIAGKYRTGKSYILNLLSDLPRNKGFALGSTVESKTKGIWVYALPHPSLRNTTLLLLDTEGLGDAEKGDIQYDTNLMMLTVLLSSTFILNVQNRLDSEVINQLGFVSKLASNMKSSSSNFEQFFPQLFVLVRDFTLQLIIKGREVSADQYFNDYCLKVKNETVKDVLAPQTLIKKYFPRRYCSTLPLPVYNRKLLRALETVPDDQLNPEFLEESADFVKRLLTVSEKKMINKKIPVNGQMLMELLRNYLHRIRNDEMPCIETTLRSTVNLFNDKLYKTFISKYQQKMRRELCLPTSYHSIKAVHDKISWELTHNFKQKIIFDEYSKDVQMQLKHKMNQMFQEILSENSVRSKESCQHRLDNISGYFSYKLDANEFCKPGGHAEFSYYVNDIIAEYNTVDEKEIKHDEVLCEFIERMNIEGDRIWNIERRLLQAQREAEEAELAKQQAMHQAQMQFYFVDSVLLYNEELRREHEPKIMSLQRAIEDRREEEEELHRQITERNDQQESDDDSSDDEKCTIL